MQSLPKGFFAILLLFFGLLFFIGAPPQKPLNFFDTGIYVQSVEWVAAGKIPYLDFATIYMPLQFYLMAAIYSVSGISIISVVESFGLLNSLIVGPLVVFLLARKLMKTSLFAFLAAFLGVLGIYWLTVRVYPAILSILFLIYFFEKGKKWFLALAGVMAGIIFLLSHEIFVYLIAASTVFFLLDFFVLKQKFKTTKKLMETKFFFFPGVLAVALFILWLAINGALGYAFDDLVLYVPRFAETISRPIPPLAGLLPQALDLRSVGLALAGLSFKFYFPIAVYLVSAIYFVQKHRSKQFSQTDFFALLVFLFGVFLFKSATTRVDFSHVAFAVAPAYILLVFMLEKISINAAKDFSAKFGRKIPAIIAIIFVFLFFIYFFVNGGFLQKTIDGLNALNNPLGNRIVSFQQLQEEFLSAEQKELVEFIHRNTSENEPVFVLPTEPLYYYFLQRPNPSRHMLVYPYNTEQEIDEIISALEEKKPRYIVYSDSEVDGKKLSDFSPKLHNYVMQNYAPVKSFSGVRVFERSG